MMKYISKKNGLALAFTFAMCLFFLPATSQAQTAASYLKMDVSARAAGMGGAFVAVADDATATNYNPAGIAKLSAPSFATMSASLGEGQKHNFFSAVYPFSLHQSAGFSWVRGTSGSASFITPAGVLSTIEDKQDAYILSYAMGLKQSISIGASLKLLRQDLGFSSAKGTSFDFGALYSFPRGITLGLNLQDISGSLKDDKSGAKSNMDFIVKFGGSMPLMEDKLLAALAFDFGVDSTDKKTLAHFGLEYYPLHESKMLALRAGFDDKFFTTGIGLALHGFNVDYSYRNKDDKGDSVQRVSVMYQLMKY